MSWGTVRGHERPIQALRSAIQSGRMPHALLFVGPEGVGKRLFAMTLAQAMLCERNPPEILEPCGRCPSCLQVVEGSHPDVLVVEKPEDRQELPIRSIRDLCHDLSLKPMRGNRRIAIVDDADSLSDEAANAFLKTLEEPPAGSVLIMIGTAPELQLDTVVSRCRVLRFDPLSVEDLAQILLDTNRARSPEEAETLAAASDGQVSRAFGLSDPELTPFLRGVLADLANPSGFHPLRFAARLDTFSNDAGKESGPKRDRARLLVGELARWLRAVLWQTAGVESHSTHPDDQAAIEALGRRLEPEDVFAMADLCLQADYQIKRNANRTLVFESLAHAFSKVLSTSV